MLLEGIMSDAGYSVVGPVGRLASALLAIGAGGTDAALLDVNVHGEDIFPAAQMLMDRGVPFAFVTGYDGEFIPVQFEGRPVLNKPFRAAELLRVLRSLIGAGSPAGAEGGDG